MISELPGSQLELIDHIILPVDQLPGQIILFNLFFPSEAGKKYVIFCHPDDVCLVVPIYGDIQL